MKKNNLLVLSGVIFSLVIMGAGCSAAPSTQNNSGATPVPNAASASSGQVAISNFTFQPGNITVKRGGKIVWTNRDSMAHTVTVDQAQGPASAPLNQGDSYTYTFETAGTFNYHCNIHPSMRGSVTVVE